MQIVTTNKQDGNKFYIPQLTSPNAVVSQSIGNFDQFKNLNSVRNIDHPRDIKQFQSRNTKDKQLNLKPNYENIKGTGIYNGPTQPPSSRNMYISPMATFERDQMQQRIFSTYISPMNQQYSSNPA